MSSFGIGLDIGPLIPPGAPVTRDMFPTLTFAVQKLGEQAQAQWQAYAAGQPLPSGAIIHSRSGGYLRSIQLRGLGDFSVEVFSDAPQAEGIESGMPSRDLKRLLDRSYKVRVNKQGKRYLIIPFRHGAPGAAGFSSVMTPAIHALAQALKPSLVSGMGQRASGTGAYDTHTRKHLMVPQRQYQWGERLNAAQLRAAGAGSKQVKQMAGMVRFQNPTGGHGQYLTFRIMSEDSPGWITKPVPGKWPARTVAEQLRPIAEKVLREAVARDIQRYLGEG